MQDMSAFSFSSFVSSCSNLFSRATPTYNQNEPYYGLKTRDNIPHFVGAVGILSAPVIGMWWYRSKKKQANEIKQRQAKFEVEKETLVNSLEQDVKNCFSDMFIGSTFERNMMYIRQQQPQSVEAIQGDLRRKALKIKELGLQNHPAVQRIGVFLQAEKAEALNEKLGVYNTNWASKQ